MLKNRRHQPFVGKKEKECASPESRGFDVSVAVLADSCGAPADTVI